MITFDGPTKRINLSATAELSVHDVYSRWKDWVREADNSKFAEAFSVVGGDAIDATAGTAVPLYAFLENGWRVKPQESSHTLNVVDGVLLVNGGGDPFVNTTGSFVVRINYQQPVQGIGFNTGGGGGASAAQVWAHVIEGALTAEQVARLLLAVAAGKSSGGGGTTVRFRDLADGKDRITATVDAQGNRAAVTRDAT